MSWELPEPTPPPEPPPAVAPGSDCPTCERRVPYPKKDSSPATRVVSFRVPVDAADDFKEIMKSAAQHLRTHENPHWQYQTFLKGLVYILQGPAGGEE